MMTAPEPSLRFELGNGVKIAADTYGDPTNQLVLFLHGGGQTRHAWGGAAQALSKANTLDDAREAFKKLSMPMAMWATMSKPKDMDVLYCSMAKASWVQKHGKVRNPYYGPKMLDSGEIVGGANHASHAH